MPEKLQGPIHPSVNLITPLHPTTFEMRSVGSNPTLTAILITPAFHKMASQAIM